MFCEQCQGNHRVETGVCVAIEPRKSYNIVSDGGTATDRIAIFSRATVEAAYGPLTPDNADEMAVRLTDWTARDGGAGRYFASAPSIRTRGRNIVVRQFCGLDI